jgi:hypothetical protein
MTDQSAFHLYLLCTPASVGIPAKYQHLRPLIADSSASSSNDVPHVRGRLDGGNVFQCNVDQAGERDERTGNVVVPVRAQEHTANEKVDCTRDPLATSLVCNPYNCLVVPSLVEPILG